MMLLCNLVLNLLCLVKFVISGPPEAIQTEDYNENNNCMDFEELMSNMKFLLTCAFLLTCEYFYDLSYTFD